MSLHAFTAKDEDTIIQTLHSTSGLRVVGSDFEKGFQAVLAVTGYRGRIVMTIEHDPEVNGNKCSFYAPFQRILENELDNCVSLGQIIRSLIFRLAGCGVFTDEGDLYVEHYN